MVASKPGTNTHKYQSGGDTSLGPVSQESALPARRGEGGGEGGLVGGKEEGAEEKRAGTIDTNTQESRAQTIDKAAGPPRVSHSLQNEEEASGEGEGKKGGKRRGGGGGKEGGGGGGREAGRRGNRGKGLGRQGTSVVAPTDASGLSGMHKHLSESSLSLTSSLPSSLAGEGKGGGVRRRRGRRNHLKDKGGPQQAVSHAHGGGGGVGSIQGSREGGREGGRVEEGAEPVAPALLLVPSTSSSPPVSLIEEEGQGEGVRSPGVLMELSTPADVKGYEMVGTLFKRRGGIGRLLGWKPRLFTLYRGKLCYYEAEYLEEVDNRRKPR